MLSKAADHSLIAGLCPEVCPGGIICLQYADDTILFLDNDSTYASNLKTVLTCFEQVSGMRINYTKSELIPINMDDQELADFLSILVCNKGNFPIKYLGIPLHYDKLRREDIQPFWIKSLKGLLGGGANFSLTEVD